jgi:hypothetical protein
VFWLGIAWGWFSGYNLTFDVEFSEKKVIKTAPFLVLPFLTQKSENFGSDL